MFLVNWCVRLRVVPYQPHWNLVKAKPANNL